MENAAALPENATQQRPRMHLRQQNPNSGERAILERAKPSHRVVNGQNWSNLVKCSNLVKDWSNERGLTTNIDIFCCLCKFGLQN